MSETTNKMRDVAIYSHSLIRVRDLAADAIEAVEAQVAKAAKRHEDLAAWCAETEARVAALEKMGRLGASPNGDDRTRGGMPPRGFDSPTPAAPTPPAPSAVPAPRGFKKGDVVRTGGLSPFDAVVVEVREPQREDWNVTIKADRGTYKWHGPDLTLVRAADAPEAPAEDAGLVERLARIIVDTPCAANHEGQCIPPGAPLDDCDRANARAVLSDLTAESRLCAPGEVARLKADRDDWKYAAEVQKKDTESWKARAETAEKALADANDRLTSQSRSIEEMHAEMVDLRDKLAAAEKALDVERRTSIDHDGKTFVHPTREARLTSTAESWSPWMKHHKRVEAERDALRAELSALKAKPRFRTRKVRAKDAEAFDKEYHKREYASGYEDYARAMNAVGLRMRVDGGK